MANRTTRVRLDEPDPDDGEEPRRRGIDGARTASNILTKAGPGRPPGVTNVVPRTIKAAISRAMELHGSDGQGKDAMDGYLFMLARDHKGLFVSLIRRTLPVQLRAELDASSLMAKMLQAAAAQRELRTQQGNGGSSNGSLIDVTPTRTRSREYAVEDYDDAS